MITASLISTALQTDWKAQMNMPALSASPEHEIYDPMDGPSEDEAYLQGSMHPFIPRTANT